MKTTLSNFTRALGILAIMPALGAGCAAPTDAQGVEAPAAAEPTAQAEQADSTAQSYSFILNDAVISRTRSPRNDTLMVAMKVYVNDQPVPSTFKTYTFGDHGSGYVPLGAWTAFVVNDSDDVKLVADVINSHEVTSGVSASGQFLDQLWADVNWLANGDTYPFDNADWLLRSQYDSFNHRLTGKCDGLVAGDAIHLHGWDLRALTASGDSLGGYHQHEGNDSANGCGSNSRYFTRYMMHRN